MFDKYCRNLLCFYFCAVLTGLSANATANGSGNEKTFHLYNEEGIRTIPRKNPIILNRDMDIPEFYPLDKEITNLLLRWKIIGASVGIAKNGKIVYAKGYGYADHQNRSEVQPDHLFRLASVSKLITATAVFRLVEQGKLSLDARVFGKDGLLNDSIYTGRIKDKRIEAITVRHLLNHTGGWLRTRNLDVAWLPDFRLNEFLPGPFNLKTKVIAYTLSHGLEAEPGTASAYSNVGYIMLGEVIERVTGKEYHDFVRESVFEPLQISDIFPGRSFKEERYADESLYYDRAGARLRSSVFGESGMVPGPYGGANIELLGPSGGWVGSVRELLKLMLAIDGFDDSPDILSENSILEMTTKEPGFYPLGWAGVSEDRWWRTGTLSGTSALMVRKSDSTSYVVLVNTSTTMRSNFTSELYRAMENAVAQVEEWPVAGKLFMNYAYLDRRGLNDLQALDKRHLNLQIPFTPEMVKE